MWRLPIVIGVWYICVTVWGYVETIGVFSLEAFHIIWFGHVSP